MRDNIDLTQWVKLISLWPSKKDNPVAFIRREAIDELISTLMYLKERAAWDENNGITIGFFANNDEWVSQKVNRPHWAISAKISKIKEADNLQTEYEEITEPTVEPPDDEELPFETNGEPVSQDKKLPWE